MWDFQSQLPSVSSRVRDRGHRGAEADRSLAAAKRPAPSPPNAGSGVSATPARDRGGSCSPDRGPDRDRPQTHPGTPVLGGAGDETVEGGDDSGQGGRGGAGDVQKKSLEPRLAEAQAGQRTVFFVDAAHFVFAPFLGVLWCVQRLFVKAPSGRQRFNVLAALHATAHELFTVTTLTYITATTVCELLQGLAGTYPGVPITLVLDNARYQRCALVQTLAATLGIELLYLPPYSPNLNLIERLWKFVKKQCLYSKYYPDSAAFQHAIRDCLAKVPTHYQAELDTLLTLRFQTFTTVPVVGDPPATGLAPIVAPTETEVLSMAA